MVKYFKLQVDKNTLIKETRTLSDIRIYGEILLLVLLVIHILAFFGFRWIEQRELRAELRPYTIAIGQPNVENGDDAEPAYVPWDSRMLIAKADIDAAREMNRVGLVIGLLYVGEVIVLLSWWAYVKEKIEAMFNV